MLERTQIQAMFDGQNYFNSSERKLNAGKETLSIHRYTAYINVSSVSSL